jgi:predicted thioesterase
MLQPGLTGTAELVVAASDTAVSLGSGDVEVLGTPRLLALLEAASVAALADALPAEQTSVGVRVELDHLKPSRVGQRVRAEATLLDVARRRLTFVVEAVDDSGLVAAGTVVRQVVDRSRFPGP